MAFKIVAFVLPLGLDTLAVAIALGLRDVAPLRPAFTFAIFEGIMPVFGMALARVISRRFEATALLVGAAILIGIGLKTIFEASRADDEDGISFGSLQASFAAGLAISTDELAIGFPLGASGLPFAAVLTAIATQALCVTTLGIAVGKRVGLALGRRASRYAGMAAGIAFAAVGLWLMLEAIIRSGQGL